MGPYQYANHNTITYTALLGHWRSWTIDFFGDEPLTEEDFDPDYDPANLSVVWREL